MNLRLLPSLTHLRIHCWGGFGSQLFAAHAALRLRRRFPNRSILVVIHTSGVTRRDQELDFELLGLDTLVVHDFEHTRVDRQGPFSWNTVTAKLENFAKFFIKGLSSLCGIFSSLENENDFSKIRFWCLSIRGHYTQISLDPTAVKTIYSLVFANTDMQLPVVQETIIHYRLGDLLVLSNKHPIHNSRIEYIVKQLRLDPQKTLVFTDSDKLDFHTYVKDCFFLSQCQSQNSSPEITLNACIQSKTFIGTNSKLSIWSAIFRNLIFQRTSHLPVELDWFVSENVNFF